MTGCGGEGSSGTSNDGNEGAGFDDSTLITINEPAIENSYSSPSAVTSHTNILGSCNSEDDYDDWFVFEAQQTGLYQLSLTVNSIVTNNEMYVLNAAGNGLDYVPEALLRDSGTDSFGIWTLRGSEYRVGVKCSFGAASDYSVKIVPVSKSVLFPALTEYEELNNSHNNRMVDAELVDTDVVITGDHSDSVSGEDWYKFYAGEGDRLKITYVAFERYDYHMQVNSDSRGALESDYSDSSIKVVEVVAENTGLHLVQVVGDAELGKGQYLLGIEVL